MKPVVFGLSLSSFDHSYYTRKALSALNVARYRFNNVHAGAQGLEYCRMQQDLVSVDIVEIT